MTQKEDWEKPRSRSVHLTTEEIAKVKIGFNCGRKPFDVARDLKCAARTISRYYETFRGNGRPKKYKPKMVEVEQPRIPAPPQDRFYKSNFEI